MKQSKLQRFDEMRVIIVELIQGIFTLSMGLLFLGTCMHFLPFLYLAALFNAIFIAYHYNEPYFLLFSGSMLMLNLMFIWLVIGNKKLMDE